MKRFFRRSFRGRLFLALLAASLVPLLLCSAMLLQIFRLRLTSSAAEEAQQYLEGALHAMDAAFEGFGRAAAALQADPVVAAGLAGGDTRDTDVNNRLFAATEGLREYARFDLYDLSGRWCYSTRSAPQARTLPTDWGVLYAAAHGRGRTYTAAQNSAVPDGAAPLLQGAAALEEPQGGAVGYLVVSLYQSDFRALLEGTYGAQNDLLVLSRYWRGVYCSQPGLAAGLAPVLRGQLLAGEKLDGGSDQFRYTVQRHPGSGLYLALRQPQVFTRGTMVQLYTVSLTCALICVAISVLMSLRLSRQMFRPIERLHQGIGEVVQDNLDVYVPPARDDELGELARRFNGMVAALKENRQALIENQRELNQAQIRMLQAQLNPHFLCNTLDTMKWISKINQVPQVALMSTDLADILRFCISPDEFVPLWREAEILERYIEIQRIRLSGAFTFELDLPPELEGCLVPKMILQPIVENAILHGLDGVKDGLIRVTALAAPGGMLRITVEDNGRGLPPGLEGPYDPGGEAGRKSHLGLYNVHTILLKYYGDGSGLYLESGPEGRGAAVTATLPIRTGEEAPC